MFAISFLAYWVPTYHIFNVGAESVLQGHHLLFSEKGVCEIHSVSTCILLDIRYDHHPLPTSIPKSFHQYLFDEIYVGNDENNIIP